MNETEVDNQADRVTRRKFLRFAFGLSGYGEDVPFKRTLIESTGFSLGNASVVGSVEQVVAEGLHKTPGNRGKDEIVRRFQQDAANAFLEGSLGAPVLEESIFRVIPSIYTSIAGGKGIMWRVGMPMALLFAAAHNVDFDESNNPRMNYDAIPLSQFTAGLFLWKLARERGYLHAILAHVVNNTIAAISILTSKPTKDPGQRPV